MVRNACLLTSSRPLPPVAPGLATGLQWASIMKAMQPNKKSTLPEK